MAFFKLNTILNCSSPSHRLKIQLFRSNVISVLLYGSETWKLTDAQLSKLRVFQTTYTRRILKIRWYHRRTNIEILRTTKQEDVGRVLEKRRWKYLGHVLRKRGSAMAVSLGWEPEGRRRPGRPKQTWRRVMLKKLKTTGIRSWNEAAELAKDRERWKQKGDMLCLPLRPTCSQKTKSSHMVIKYTKLTFISPTRFHTFIARIGNLFAIHLLKSLSSRTPLKINVADLIL